MKVMTIILSLSFLLNSSLLNAQLLLTPQTQDQGVVCSPLAQKLIKELYQSVWTLKDVPAKKWDKTGVGLLAGLTLVSFAHQTSSYVFNNGTFDVIFGKKAKSYFSSLALDPIAKHHHLDRSIKEAITLYGIPKDKIEDIARKYWVGYRKSADAENRAALQVIRDLEVLKLEAIDGLYVKFDQTLQSLSKPFNYKGNFAAFKVIREKELARIRKLSVPEINPGQLMNRANKTLELFSLRISHDLRNLNLLAKMKYLSEPRMSGMWNGFIRHMTFIPMVGRLRKSLIEGPTNFAENNFMTYMGLSVDAQCSLLDTSPDAKDNLRYMKTVMDELIQISKQG